MKSSREKFKLSKPQHVSSYTQIPAQRESDVDINIQLDYVKVAAMCCSIFYSYFYL